jgi:hypothetical protein
VAEGARDEAPGVMTKKQALVSFLGSLAAFSVSLWAYLKKERAW